MGMAAATALVLLSFSVLKTTAASGAGVGVGVATVSGSMKSSRFMGSGCRAGGWKAMLCSDVLRSWAMPLGALSRDAERAGLSGAVVVS